MQAQPSPDPLPSPFNPIEPPPRDGLTRRDALRAAFAKITTGVLLELGLHNPLAAAIGRSGQSEWALALELLAQVPKQALLLADRLHGCAAFVAAAQAPAQLSAGRASAREQMAAPAPQPNVGRAGQLPTPAS